MTSHKISATVARRIVFIISAPRAGSTLLQKMLSEHHDIYSGVESYLLFNCIAAPNSNAQFRDTVRDATMYLLAEHEIKRRGNKHSSGNLSCQEIESVYETVLEKTNSRYFLDKTPSYTKILPQISEVCPESKFVLLVRNPLALLNSGINTWLNGNLTKLYWLKSDLIDSQKALRDFCQDSQNRYIQRIKYEDLVSEPRHSIRKILRLLKLETHFKDDEQVSYTVKPRQINSDKNQFYGDPKSIFKHDGPVTDYAEGWLTLAENPVTYHFALDYLETLGSQLISDLGYSQNDLISRLTDHAVKAGTHKKHPTLSFATAITSTDRRTLKQNHEVRQFELFGHRGRFARFFYTCHRIKNRLVRRAF